MATAAQILANRSNAQLSTGPVTAEGKLRVARNATTSGLFSATAFVRPGEEQIFQDFTSGYLEDLSPAGPVEDTLAREIVHAAWRLRRCAELEAAPPADATEDDLHRLQASIDRARTVAQRGLHRSLAELRRLQTERAERVVRRTPPTFASFLENASFLEKAALTKQTQSAPPPPLPVVARNAACPCGSGEKYKRCCGRNASPMLAPGGAGGFQPVRN